MLVLVSCPWNTSRVSASSLCSFLTKEGCEMIVTNTYNLNLFLTHSSKCLLRSVVVYLNSSLHACMWLRIKFIKTIWILSISGIVNVAKSNEQ